MLVTMAEILNKAKEGGYGVVAPNVFNSDTIKACFEAAQEMKSPLILDVVGEHDIENCGNIAVYFSKKFPDVPVAINLDHGSNWQQAVLAVKNGYTSIMTDRSNLTYEENVEQVKETVKLAHSVGLSVEAELGHVGQGYEYSETRNSGLTDPEEAVRFVKETGVDCLAVAIGTSHGVYKGTPYLDFDLLKVLSKRIDVPLVLHGGSGTGDENLAKAVKLGIQKVNMFTDLSFNALEYMKEYEKDKRKFKEKYKWDYEIIVENPRMCELFKAGVFGYKQKVKYYMELFGSNNKW